MNELLHRIRGCTVCVAHLPFPPQPVLQASPRSRILVIGQAPGLRAHETGIAWNDASGVILRKWLGVSTEQFYDPDLFAIIPMGFCFPGKGDSGDRPPRPECAPEWHRSVISNLNSLRLTILVGSYAQRYYLRESGFRSLIDSVYRFREFLPEHFPLPHPSPRNRPWITNNPWFEAQVVPALAERVRSAIE